MTFSFEYMGREIFIEGESRNIIYSSGILSSSKAMPNAMPFPLGS
ncbi:hypothetical protein [Borreliella lanei]|uniref:Biopterin-dependent aromatic amino acid hydroxylase family profile domain-containing protein n=1 Tax=Borreliella lanei TaxID=373540 RepID=A0A7X0DJ33_9SPIR|nr:hypothetical protein [Borreliella lanei]MBB6207511.1 hypothetical protein [Borreliella lanei]WKC86651.1 hypothetical protein QIA23_04810 [Borreliella lanei]